MDFWTGFFIGMSAGAVVGMMLMAMLSINKCYDCKDIKEDKKTDSENNYFNEYIKIVDVTDAAAFKELILLSAKKTLNDKGGNMTPIMLKDESQVKNKLKISFNEALLLLGLSAAGVVILYAWGTFLWWMFFNGVVK